MTNTNIEFLLNLEYDNLKTILLSMNEQQLKEVLQNYELKQKIINSHNKYDFVWFAQTDNDYIFPLLLDDIGINILTNSNNLIDKMNAILTSGTTYTNKLFDNKNFLKLIIDNLNELYNYLYCIEANSAKKLLEYTNDSNIQLKIISSLRNEVEELVKIYTINNEILMKSIIILPSKASKYLLKNDLRITSLNSFNFSELLNLFNKSITLPPQLLEDKELLKKITTISDPKNYRILIESLSNNNDTEFIELKRKEYYETEIKSFNHSNNMLDKYYNIYVELTSLFDNNNYSYEQIEKVINKYINPFGNDSEKFLIIDKIFEYKNNKEKLKEFFQKESHYQLTNMIIDYHFEDIYYNFLLDLKQLYNFQKTEGKTLNDEDIKMYENTLNLDDLSYTKKLELFELLKFKNPLEKYYDDFREAKNKAYSMIKEQMLNFDNITKYKNEELSKKTGIDIYVLDGDPFYAFIKSFHESKYNVLSNINSSYVDGSSYSLDGSNKLNTFKNPKEYYNILYGDFNIDQVVHMYPVDSFSKYKRNSNTKATKRVNELYTPDTLVNKSNQYNEIIYSQKNDYLNDELNNSLDRPKPLAIYCYDEITENDIESAKKLGIGITLVKTKSYNIDRNKNKLNMFDTIGLLNKLDGINYLEYYEQDAMKERRK